MIDATPAKLPERLTIPGRYVTVHAGDEGGAGTVEIRWFGTHEEYNDVNAERV